GRVSRMAFDWYAFPELARSLGQNAAALGEEAARRSSVSRAYYAAFCFVRDYARDNLGFQARDEAADHGALRARLRRDYVNELPFDLPLTNDSAIDQAELAFQALRPSPKSA